MPNDVISAINAKRAIVARAIQAENDRDAIRQEYIAAIRRARTFGAFPRFMVARGQMAGRALQSALWDVTAIA